MAQQPPPTQPQKPVPAILQGVSELDLSCFPARRDAGDGGQIAVRSAQALIRYADEYGLDAWAGHVCYMYGVPYIGEKGAIALASQSPQYRGFTVSHGGDEARQALNLGPDDMVWVCEVYRKDRDVPIRDYGVVAAAEVDQLQAQIERRVRREWANRQYTPQELEREVLERLSYVPLSRRPGLQAKVRAIRRAHLAAFPLRRRGEERAPVTPDEPMPDPGELWRE